MENPNTPPTPPDSSSEKIGEMIQETLDELEVKETEAKAEKTKELKQVFRQSAGGLIEAVKTSPEEMWDMFIKAYSAEIQKVAGGDEEKAKGALAKLIGDAMANVKDPEMASKMEKLLDKLSAEKKPNGREAAA